MPAKKASKKASSKKEKTSKSKGTAKGKAAAKAKGKSSEEGSDSEEKPIKKETKRKRVESEAGAADEQPPKRPKAASAPGALCAKLRCPDGLSDTAHFQTWFGEVADFLLNGAVLHINGIKHRFSEIEFYFCGDAHPDTFTHRDEMQLTSGQWYFHKKGKTYKSGTYKGLDLTFGSDEEGKKVHGGILIRCIEPLEGGDIIQGSCRVADHILKTCGVETIPELVEGSLGGTEADGDKPDRHTLLFITAAQPGEVDARPIVKSARIGLTLKQASKDPTLPAYIARKYRHMTVPHLLDKKQYVSCALHEAGHTPEEIRAITKQTAKHVDTHIAAFEKGKKGKWTKFVGKALKVGDICEMFGAVAAAVAGGGFGSASALAAAIAEEAGADDDDEAEDDDEE